MELSIKGESMNQNIQQTNIQFREIPISQLPDTCKSKNTLKTWVIDPDKTSVFVVAKTDNSHFWIAYIGYPTLDKVSEDLRNQPFIQYHCTNMSSQVQVLAYGDVLDEQSARELFPEWDYRRYRT